MTGDEKGSQMTIDEDTRQFNRLRREAQKRASRRTVNEFVMCPVCQRGDVWQEAVNRTEYVYKGEAVKDGQEVIDYLLAEVASLLEAQNH